MDNNQQTVQVSQVTSKMTFNLSLKLSDNFKLTMKEPSISSEFASGSFKSRTKEKNDRI